MDARRERGWGREGKGGKVCMLAGYHLIALVADVVTAGHLLRRQDRASEERGPARQIQSGNRQQQNGTRGEGGGQ